MKRSGKLHWMMAVGLLGVIVIVGLLFFKREGPETVASKFLTALTTRDAAKLTELSYYPGSSKEELRKQWDFATQVAGRDYQFVWKIKFAKMADENTATVALEFTRDAVNPMSYGENFQLPMVREDGQWLVDVRSLSKVMYPALPR